MMSNLCDKGKHGVCHDEKVNCGCNYPIKNLKGKDLQRILDLARQEEIEKTERLIAGLGIFTGAES